MRRIAGREAARRAKVAPSRETTSQSRPERAPSLLFQVLDRDYEIIAASRPDRSRWDAVLRWLDEHRIRDRHGEPVTAGLLAITWREVGLARAARPLGRNGSFEEHDAASASIAAKGEIPTMMKTGMGAARPAAFGGEFATALEVADRRSPLYLFLYENYDEICAHRPKHGGWHKFLAVLNEKGILDGQGNVVSMRVLWRTWEKVKKTILADRNRPAARLTPQPVGPQRVASEDGYRAEPPAPPAFQNEPRPVVRPPSTEIFQRQMQPQTQSSSPWFTPHREAPSDEPNVILNLRQAWHIQRLRNEYVVESGLRPNTTLDNDLVKNLDEESLRIFIEGRSTPGIGLARHQDIYVN